MKAKDVMAPIEEYLTTTMSVKEAVNRMRKVKRHHGLPIRGMLVKDEQGKVVGILSNKDILRAAIPPYLSADLSIFSWEHMLEEMINRAKDKKVGDIMVKDVVTIDSDAPLMVCADLMIKKQLQRLPVTDENKEIIGMVYMRDIYDFMIDTLDKMEAENGTS